MSDVTVVITTYNRADTVVAAVQSALAHTAPLAATVVVVVDGSTDHTAEALAAIDDPRLTVVHQENSGMTVARNRGLELADGEWVAFLDDDDQLLPAWGPTFAPLMQVPDSAIVSGAVEFVEPDGQPAGTEPPSPLGPVFDDAVAQYLAGCFAVRRSVVEQAGGYLPGLPCSHQTELFIRLVATATAAGMTVRSENVPVAQVERRAQHDRAMQRPTLLRDGSRWVLARFVDRFAADRAERAGWESLVAVAAVRTGAFDLARDYSLRAVRSRPADPQTWLRAAMVRVPSLARRKWTWTEPSEAVSPADSDPLVNAGRLGQERGLPAVDRFFLPWGYQENEQSSADSAGTPFWEGGLEENDVRYQDAVYRWVGRLVKGTGATVMDVGCGSGDKLVRHVAPRAGRSIGVDQPSGIRLASERFGDHEWVSVDLAEAASWSQLGTMSPDLVLCSDVVEHLEDPYELLVRLRDLAGPSGRVVVSTPDRERLRTTTAAGPPHNPRHVREWSASEFRLLLESAGLRVLETKHFLPRKYSLVRTDVHLVGYRLLHGRPVPDDRSSMAFLAVPA